MANNYASAPTLCPALMAVLGVIFLPALWPLIVVALLVGIVVLVACAIGALS